MSEKCEWLHRELEKLPLVMYPFQSDSLPRSGIYFFYEEGETWGHGGQSPRVVRIGTHRGKNFRSRISEHFLFKENRMDFDESKPKPSDRSIFRKNIGRTLLNQEEDPYLEVWEIGFMNRKNKDRFGHLRDIGKEKELEGRITRILRERFSFRFIIIESEADRMGAAGLEGRLIGTVSGCAMCAPSPNWPGRHSPKAQIRDSGLWLVQHLKDAPIDEQDKQAIRDAVQKTLDWVVGSYKPV